MDGKQPVVLGAGGPGTGGAEAMLEPVSSCFHGMGTAVGWSASH